MEQNVVETPHLLNAWAWIEKNRKQVGVGVAVVAGVGLIIGYSAWSRAEKEEAASHALSETIFTINRGAAEPVSALQKVAAENDGTKAGTHALLLAAGALFSGGKYAEAQGAFERFARDNSGNPLVPQALYGSGAALAAQGKLNEAAAAYKSVVDRFPNAAVAPQARFALAGALVAQGDLKQAAGLYEDVARGAMNSSLGNEAGLRAEELRAKLPPEPAPSISVTSGAASNAPAAKP